MLDGSSDKEVTAHQITKHLTRSLIPFYTIDHPSRQMLYISTVYKKGISGSPWLFENIMSFQCVKSWPAIIFDEVKVTYDSLELFDLEVTLIYHLRIGGRF